jgi:tRNA(fMet)-specific endonuclease VapC
MLYLLDSNICIHFFKGSYNLISKLEEVGMQNCCISEITLAELIYRAECSLNPEKNKATVQAFHAQLSTIPIFNAIELYGKEKARLRKLGTPISDFDLLIGCSAVVHDLIMVTENTREFERIEAIKIENWIIRA